MDSKAEQSELKIVPPEPPRGKDGGHNAAFVAALVVVGLLFVVALIALVFFFPRPVEPSLLATRRLTAASSIAGRGRRMVCRWTAWKI